MTKDRSADYIEILLNQRFPGYTEEIEKLVVDLHNKRKLASSSDEVVKLVLEADGNPDTTDVEATEPKRKRRTGSKAHVEDVRKWLVAAWDYAVHLEGLSLRALSELYRDKLKPVHDRAEMQRKRYDENAFFSEVSADADFDYWKRRAVWSLEEATALSLGKEPRVVSSKSLHGTRPGSPFRKAYLDRLDRLNRAVIAEDIKPPHTSLSLIAWMHNCDEFDLPVALTALVEGADEKPSPLDYEGVSRLSVSKVLVLLASKAYGITAADLQGRIGHNQGQRYNRLTMMLGDLKKVGLRMDRKTVLGVLTAAHDDLDSRDKFKLDFSKIRIPKGS